MLKRDYKSREDRLKEILTTGITILKSGGVLNTSHVAKKMRVSNATVFKIVGNTENLKLMILKQLKKPH
jgi:Mn-dependent DtxR family transcriptional regulator